MPSIGALLFALVMTWLIEWVVVAVWTRRASWRQGLDLFWINALTNPLAHLAVYQGGLSVPLVEGMVALVEIGLFHALLGLGWRTALPLAITANLTSFLLGFALIFLIPF